MNVEQPACSVDSVLFDFGGVLAEEGFANGLRAIAQRYGLDENKFRELARELMHSTGYIVGRASEARYWQALRDATGITGSDNELRNEILSRFVPRPFMLDIVRQLKGSGIRVAILSDQTNWLDELDARYDLFRQFDAVYNSFHVGKSKFDASQFSDVVSRMQARPERVLFVDDDEGHCLRALSMGLNAIRYAAFDAFLKDLGHYCTFHIPSSGLREG
ncbi:MAG: HAD family phosphatase [Deltaproteobacteria bacterium]|nr:HAD family phosphatase [Deltaproteobacteria bacterium]